MGLSEMIFQHHSQVTEKLDAIFLHFLTKQTHNHLNLIHKIQLREQLKKKKHKKENSNPCLPNKAIRVQIIGGELPNLVVLWPNLVVLWKHTM
jgi:hypothetical protein